MRIEKTPIKKNFQIIFDGIFSSDSENNCLISYVIDPKNSNNNTIEVIKLKIIKYYIKLLYNFFSIYKNAQRFTSQILPKNKESLQNKLREKYQDLYQKEKNKKRQHGCERYKNLPEGKK